MEKTGIIYATKTKHSAKLAEAIGMALGIPAQNIVENPVIQNLDLLIIASGIYGGEGLPELLTYLKDLDPAQVKKAALVTSCASGFQKQNSARKILEEKGIPVVDEFVCKGGFLFVAARHPDAKDAQAAVEFAKRIAR